MGDVEQGFSRAAGGYASTSGAAGPRTEAGRDRDPPPGYDGIDPETTFRQYEKQVALWEFETDVARAKRGVKLLRQLSGIAQTAVDHLEVDQITGEDGVKNLLTALREYFNPHLEVSLPRAFEAAVYGAPRASKETFGEFTKRMERAFVNLAKEGVDLPDGARGYIMYRQASLSESQEQRLLTWAQGCYGRKEMTVALRRLDKVIRDKEKGKSSFVMEEGHEAEVHTSEAYLNEDSGYPDDDDENFVYIADGDLDEIMDEQEVVQALASYQETRQALKDQRLNRGYYPGKGKGKLNAFQKGKDKGKRKVHIEQLKLRSRCKRCQQIGHWARECTNPPAPTTGEGRAFFVGLAPESQGSRGERDFWLRQFLQDQKGQSSSSSPDSKADAAYTEHPAFCGITTKPVEGVVDTAAEGGLIGSVPLVALQSELHARGLQIRWTPKRSQAKGVGGNAQVLGVALIPIGLGGINGVLETTVIEGDVPFLLPIRMLRALESLIDLKRCTLTLQAHGRVIDLNVLHSGHITVNIFSFANGQFITPEEVDASMSFELQPQCFMSAMSSQGERNSQFAHEPSPAPFPLRHHGGHPPDGKRLSGKASNGGSYTDGHRSSCCEPKGSTPELEGRVGQDCHHPGARRPPRGYGRVVFGVGAIAAGIQVGGQHRGLLCRGDPARGSIEAAEVEDRPYSLGEFMHSPEGPTPWGRQWNLLVRGVPSMPFQMGPRRKSSRDPEATEARPLEHTTGQPIQDSRSYEFGAHDTGANWGTSCRPDFAHLHSTHEDTRSDGGNLGFAGDLRAELARDEGEFEAGDGHEQSDHAAAVEETSRPPP